LLPARAHATARALHLFGEHAGAVQLDDLQRALREMQQVGRAVERVAADVTLGEILELAARGIERAADLAADEIEGMRREIVRLELGRHRRAHPERLRASLRAGRTARDAPPATGVATSTTGCGRAA